MDIGEAQAVSALLPAAGATSCTRTVGADGQCGQPQCMSGGGRSWPAPGVEPQCVQEGKGRRVGRFGKRGKAWELESSRRMALGQQDFPLTGRAHKDLPSLRVKSYFNLRMRLSFGGRQQESRVQEGWVGTEW